MSLTPMLLDRLSRTVSRASGLVYSIVLETAAHGTVRTTGAYNRVELVQDRAQGKIDVFDAAPVVLIRAADALGTQTGDVMFIDGRLFHIRKPLEDGSGGMKISLEPPQRLAAEWRDSGGPTRSIGLYPAGQQTPSGDLNVAVGGTLAAIAATDEVLGLAPGAELRALDGSDWQVKALGAWVPGWARLILKRAA